MPIFPSLVGAMDGAGEGVDDNDKIYPKALFLDLEMMGEGGGNGASWWEGRVWAETRRKMSNPVKHH